MYTKTYPFARGYLRPALAPLAPRRLEKSTSGGEEADVPALVDRKDGGREPAGDAVEPPGTRGTSHSLTEALAAREGVLRESSSSGRDDKAGPRTGGALAKDPFPATDSIRHLRAWFDTAAAGSPREGRSPAAIASYCLDFAEFEAELAHGLTHPCDDHAELRALARKLASNPLEIPDFHIVSRVLASPEDYLEFPVGKVARSLERVRQSAREEAQRAGPSSGDTAGAAAVRRLEGVLDRFALRPHVPIGVPEPFFREWLKDPPQARRRAEAEPSAQQRDQQLSFILGCELIQILSGSEGGEPELRDPSPVGLFLSCLEGYDSASFLVLRNNAAVVERYLENLMANGPVLLRAGKLTPEEFERDICAAVHYYADVRNELTDHAAGKLHVAETLLGDTGKCAAALGAGPSATGEPVTDEGLATQRAEEVLARKPAFLHALKREHLAARLPVPGLEERVVKALDDAPGMAKLQVGRAIEWLEKMPRSASVPSRSDEGQGSQPGLPQARERDTVPQPRRKQRATPQEPRPGPAKGGLDAPDEPPASGPKSLPASAGKVADETPQSSVPDRKARHLRNMMVREQGGRLGPRGVPEPASAGSVPQGRSAWHTTLSSSSGALSTTSSTTSQTTTSTSSLAYDPALAQSLRTYKDAVNAFAQAGYQDSTSGSSHHQFSADDKKSFTIAQHGGLAAELPRNRRKDIAKFLSQHAGVKDSPG